MKSLIKKIKKYIHFIFVSKVDFKDAEFRSETETIVTLKIRFIGHKKFIKNYRDNGEWYEYNSYRLYHGIVGQEDKIKKLSRYTKDYEYVLDLVLNVVVNRPEIKGIYRDKKISEILK